MNFNLKLFNTTETELKAIAALASIGFNSSPFIGNKTPAANGIPITLYMPKTSSDKSGGLSVWTNGSHREAATGRT